MNLELSFEQKLLRESAEGILRRAAPMAAARDALEGGAAPDHWALAAEAGWTDLFQLDESRSAGAGLFDAMLVMEECGAALASPGLVGHLPARVLLAGTPFGDEIAPDLGRIALALTSGEAAYNGEVVARDTAATAGCVNVDGAIEWIVDGVRAETLLVETHLGGRPMLVAIPTAHPGVTVADLTRYDMTRPLAAVRLNAAEGQVIDHDGAAVTRARYTQQALLGAEAVGTARSALRMAVDYAKDRHTFGRPIGSYQGVKHRLVEMARLAEIARSLMYRVAWADECEGLHEFVVSACAIRAAGDRACFYAADQNLYVHGGIGATWEHDGHLLFRRAQVSRRLLGGTAGATRAVAELLIQGREWTTSTSLSTPSLKT